MTYSDDLCRRLLIIAHRIGEQDVERGAIAIEALEADNAALRQDAEYWRTLRRLSHHIVLQIIQSDWGEWETKLDAMRRGKGMTTLEPYGDWIETLNDWASNPSIQGYVPVFPNTLRMLAEYITILKADNAALRAMLERAKAFIDPHALRVIHEIEQLLAGKEQRSAFSSDVLRDAERYREVRSWHWSDRDRHGPCVTYSRWVTLGADCPSEERLDEIVDNMIAGKSP